tara:strand:- start:101 stop:307 length:207 start_codon:yes stop_codon:yes gene_type:complete
MKLEILNDFECITAKVNKIKIITLIKLRGPEPVKLKLYNDIQIRMRYNKTINRLINNFFEELGSLIEG